MANADELAKLLGERQIACAESCTGGLVAQALAKAADSQEWFRGGIVVYQRATKFDLLDVSPGPVVTERAACEMADGAAKLFSADVAVSVTGAARTDPLDGAEPGTVIIGVFLDGESQARTHNFEGDPASVCAQARDEALRTVREVLLSH